MGELLLCSQELASVPYFMEDASLNVYSLEEICCYLQNNIDLIEPSFMDKDLIYWIRTELKLPQLSDRLLKVMQEDGGLSEFVGVLASGCSYCSHKEILLMQETLRVFENKSETECKKIRADRFLEKKRYRICILEYRKILESHDISEILAGNIYHNLGTAYAGMFFFEDAAKCYKKAYERNKNPLSLQQQGLALHLAQKILPDKDDVDTSSFQMPEILLKQWKESYLKNSR